jgi:hypothetical protein
MQEAPGAKKDRVTFTPEMEEGEHSRNLEQLNRRYGHKLGEDEITTEYLRARTAFADKQIRNYVPIFALKMADEALKRRLEGGAPDRDF